VHVDPVDVHRRGDVSEDEQPAKHVVWVPVWSPRCWGGGDGVDDDADVVRSARCR
jgi:hypothetical protein